MQLKNTKDYNFLLSFNWY